MWGEESDIQHMRLNGALGDFIVYEKPEDREYPIRIAFLISDTKASNQLKTQKVKVQTTKTGNKGGFGIAMQSAYLKWHDSLSDLVHSCKGNVNTILLRPYLYSDAESPAAETKICSTSNPHTPPTIKGNITNDALNLEPNNANLIDDPSGDEIEIIYDAPKPRDLIADKPVGTFFIHKNDSNTEENPYTIYAVTLSKSGDRNKVLPASVFYNSEEKCFTIGRRGKEYPSLLALINGNNVKLQHHYIETHYIDQPNPNTSRENRKQDKRKPQEENYEE